MKFYTFLGDQGFLWVLLSVVMLCFRAARKSGVAALCAMLLGYLSNNLILKTFFARPRPYLMVPGLMPLLAPPDPGSFPSGHTCAAFAAAVSWIFTLPRRWRGFAYAGFFGAVLMGFSRVYVGVHYPSDVVAGAVVGSLCGCLIYMLSSTRSRISGRLS